MARLHNEDGKMSGHHNPSAQVFENGERVEGTCQRCGVAIKQRRVPASMGEWRKLSPPCKKSDLPEWCRKCLKETGKV